METKNLKVYRYRWVILFVFALLNIVVQIQWITFAPITGESAAFYGVSPLQIGMLSMVFMIIYILVTVPASYVIDTYGIKIGIGIGAVLTAVFGLLKGIFGTNFTMVFIAQIGLAVAQPFVLNAYTKVSARWFPINERGTSTGIATLSMYIGIIIALIATPFLFRTYHMKGMLMIYGILSLAIAIIFMIFIKERPLTAPSIADQRERFKVFQGIKYILTNTNMLILLFIFFIGLGIFNSITTWIEQIVSPRGFNSEQAGIIGGLMFIGGITGASILPAFSDKYRKRKPFLLIALIGMAPALAGITFITNYAFLLVAAFAMGFFMMSAGPIGFQYGAELSYPAPEATSQGLILLAGQISGILFIFGMDKLRSSSTGAMTPSLVIFIGLIILTFLLALKLKESTLVRDV
ncbi:putative glucarate transporter [bacterium BMS3Abin05]|nr:putative glucarate transporter [bacterium BMS3Abin05]GBE27537.1 putative glucarate transporter [bacterium BMS3Bbin03]HDK35746.1 MFS transporter [Bacteroidota bacterium]HDZ10756.1 MFS transporter [Bacteroidota bacterium]